MLSEAKQTVLEELLSGASATELAWINGYLSGLLSVKGKPVTITTGTPVRVTIAYGTETGNAKALAGKLATIARHRQVVPRLVSLEQYRVQDLSKESLFFLVVSTQGDGEPPKAAEKFFGYINSSDVSIASTKYGVIALGDSSYPLFCQAGIDADNLLEQRGGTRIRQLIKCDTDYEQDATEWFESALEGISTGLQPVPKEVPAGRQIKDYEGQIRTNVNLNDRGSLKRTHHIEIAAGEVAYEPGDALSIVPENEEQQVALVISQLGLHTEQTVVFRGKEYTVYDLLHSKLNISWLPERVVAAYASLTQQEIPAVRISLADLLRIYPAGQSVGGEKILGILEPIAPRLYSIASAPSAHDGELHLTVSRQQFYAGDAMHSGLCSGFLSRLEAGRRITFRIHPNRQFHLPDPAADIIMIGPGTGIAPFRSFLAEREATGATGRNWLFFGEQHFETDFLYQTEVQGWHESGLLTKTGLAFSRDQEEKIYVQHKMKEHAGELYQWLESGAYIYVCGSRSPMSADVRLTWQKIIRDCGGYSEEGAASRFEQLLSDGRYKEDVY